MEIYLKLLGTAMIPIIMSIGFSLLQKATAFSKLKPWIQQAIIGAIFGIAAIYGTAFGVDIGGATVNARDAAPLCAGLFFGGPAGIIAGIMGAVYRWIAAEVYGIGVYTKVACTVSTFLAGVYAALLRKYIFEGRLPKWHISFLIGVIIEAFHMLMVFITHADDATQALEILKICTMPMILVNSFAISAAAALLALINRILILKQGERINEDKPTISERIQVVLLIIVVAAFVATSSLSYAIQTNQTKASVEQLLMTNIQDVADDVADVADAQLMDIAKSVAKEYDTGKMRDLDTVAKWYGITEVNIVDKYGIIRESTNSSFVGFDMNSGTQSQEFLWLINNDEVMVQDMMPISKDSAIKRKYAGASVSDGGFIQVGVDDTKLYDKIADSLVSIAKNRHIGNTGLILIADSRNRIVSCADESFIGRNIMATGIWVWDEFEEMTTYEEEAFGEDAYCMFLMQEGYIIIGVYPTKEAMISRDFNIYMNVFSQILVFAFLFAAIYFCINSVVVKRLKRVNNSLEKITGGDLNEVVDVHTTQEFTILSSEINTTVGRLKEYIAEAAARIDAELEFAKNIQCSTLPSNFPAFPENAEFDIYATMDAAKEVGGDFYDFYKPSDDKLAFLVADVSGKGIPAALFMMQAKTMINGFISAGLSVDRAFSMSNTKLCEGNEAEMFVTAWQGVMDIKTGHVEFANAGHNPPVVYRKGEGWSYLKSKVGFVLAGMDGVQYKMQELDLNPGDKIYLYTDGVVEAQNMAQELYGEDRLLTYLNAHPDDGPEAVLKGVREDVDLFVGDAEQFDDITMLMVEYKG